jgi:hypothetical protein
MCAGWLLGEGVVEDRYCGNCGHALKPDDKFCSGCGKPVHETARVSTAEDVADEVPPNDGGRRRTSGAGLLAVLLAFGFIVALFAMAGGGANVATWMAHGGVGYILGLAIVVGILFLFLFLLRRRD